MKTVQKGLAVFIALWVVGLNGCSTPKPFEYETDRELKPGPGLFSGEDGAFTIYRKRSPSEAEGPEDSQNKEESISKEDI